MTHPDKAYVVYGYIPGYEGTEYFWVVATFTDLTVAEDCTRKCQAWADQKRLALKQEFEIGGEKIYRQPDEVSDRFYDLTATAEGRAQLQDENPYDPSFIPDIDFGAKYIVYETALNPVGKPFASTVVVQACERGDPITPQKLGDLLAGILSAEDVDTTGESK